jgi:hypothetical protein
MNTTRTLHGDGRPRLGKRLLSGRAVQGDRIAHAILCRVACHANGIDPMTVIRWKDILETLEAAVDACRSVANVLEGVGLKRGERPLAAPGS